MWSFTRYLKRSGKQSSGAPARRRRLAFDVLESRYAPATIVSPTQLTYQDIDGDNVTVTFSKPILTSDGLANSFFGFSSGNVNGNDATPQQLYRLDLRGSGAAAAAGTNITIEAEPAGGDGVAHVGVVEASLRDLGKVTIDGGLGRILAGDSNLKTPALKALHVGSMGVQGFSTQGGAGDLHTVLNGSVGKIVVAGDVQNADITALGTNSNGFRMGNIGLLDIGGSLIGGGAEKSGHIFTGGSIAEVRIGGSVIGGAGVNSGSMFAEGGLRVIQIGGSLQGATGAGSGAIACNTAIASLSMGGSIIGGNSGTSGSGIVQTYGKIKRMVVGGSIAGGFGFHSGLVQANSDIVSLTINGSLLGGLGQYSGRVISRFGSIRDVFVGGDIASGIGFETGIIGAGNNVGNIVVQGSIVGRANSRLVIAAQGADGPARIGTITVAGSVQFADILAGYEVGLFRDRTNSDARIGKVSVGGNWQASNLVAGVDVGADELFGTADDGAAAAGSPTFISRISAITIGGTAGGTSGGTDHFGIVAEQVKALSINGAAVPLNLGSLSDLNVSIGNTGDFQLNELEA
jgi:hypothetical protein